MRIVVCGDSIAFGEHVPTSERWTTLMAQANPEWNVLTRAVCQETTRQALERFPLDVQATNPDVVVVSFGHNDANVWECDNGLPRVSEGAYVANLAEMVERSRRAGAGQVVLCTPHRTNGLEDYEQRLERYASLVYRVRDVTDCRVCETRCWPFGLLPDGLHLDSVGHELMAEVVAVEVTHGLLAAV